MKTDLYQLVNESYFNQQSFPILEHFLQPKLEKIDEGYVEVSMTVKAEHLNLHRILHGGVLASVADLTMGIACISHYKSIVTSEMNLSFIRSVTEGKKIVARATVDHNGKTLMRTTCLITNEQGQLLLKAMGTFFVLGPLEINNPIKE